MKGIQKTLYLVGLLSIIVLQINAQQINQNKNEQEILDADISITADVTARELKFETIPNPTVEFPGTKKRTTIWEADRQNLPTPIELGVTYRNIGIQLRIKSRFADIERIVAEALGEVSITSDLPETKSPSVQITQTQKSKKSPKR